MRKFRLLAALGLIASLGAFGADLALAHRMSMERPERSLWSLVSAPVRQTVEYSLNPLAEPVHLLVIGTDTVYGSGGKPLPGAAGHSDTMLFVRIQPATQRIDVLSIPRDTLVRIPGKGLNKMSAVNFLGGTVLVKNTVESLLRMPVHHTVRLDMAGLRHMVDAIGGVTVNVDKPLHYDDHTARLHIHFDKGTHHLDGQKAMEYLRFRHDPLGDIGRVRRQQGFLRALVAQTLQGMTMWQLPELVRAVQENAEIDLPPGLLWRLGSWYCLSPAKALHLAVVPGKFDQYAHMSIWRADRQALAKLLHRVPRPGV